MILHSLCGQDFHDGIWISDRGITALNVDVSSHIEGLRGVTVLLIVFCATDSYVRAVGQDPSPSE